jgi:MFS family permease
VFYGWIIVGVAFVTQFMLSGFVFYSFGVVLKELAADFGGGRTGVSAVHLVMPWTGALIAPFVGRWAGRGHLRLLMTLGAAATGTGLLLTARASHLWQLYVIFPTLISFGANTLGGVCASALVVNWFERRRATALGLSQIGASGGGMIMGPVAAALVASHGWRGTYTLFGLILLAMIPLLWILTVSHPQERGLRADGVPDPRGGSPDPAPAHAPAAFSTAGMFRDPNLWRVAFLTGVGFMLSSAVVTHIVAFGTDAGLDRLQASSLLSVMATGALIAKPIFGSLSDRVGERPSFAISLGLQGLGLLGVLQAPGGWGLFAVVALLGLGIGGNLPVSAALAARAFGTASFGPVLGLVMLLITPLVSVGTPFAGWIFDRTGSYAPAFWTFLAALALAGLVLWRVDLRERAG